jgi:hypothetical protein
MRSAIYIFVLAATSSGCKSTDCGPGTIDHNGTCDPADLTTSTAQCGSGTQLEGDRCVSLFPPTQCDPATTTPDIDPTTGVTTCIGNGTGGGCSGVFACPLPMTGKQTICGQIYDVETNMPFRATGATGTQCTAGATSGPCALAVNAYDAVAFGENPTTATPLANGGIYIDDCGRYRITDLTQPSSTFVGLGFDDATAANVGPGGVTNPTGIALAGNPGAATKGVEAWIAATSTTDKWMTSGGPPVSGGIYAAIFRAHTCDANTGVCTGDAFANQAGVIMTKGMPTRVTEPAKYFTASETGRTTIDSTATATGANGTALVTGASVLDGFVYSGNMGLSDTTNCQWEFHAAASLPNIVFFQVYRPTNTSGHTCTL